MARNPKVAIYWDFENCPPPSKLENPLQCYELVNRIQDIAQRSGVIQDFRAYSDSSALVTEKCVRLRSELSSVGIEFLDCPHVGRKDVVDKRIIVDMLLFAADSNTPVTIVLITGDHDYMYAVSKLMHRHHRVVVLAPSVASVGLKSIASEFHDWDDEVVGPARSIPRTCYTLGAYEIGDTCDTKFAVAPHSSVTNSLPFAPSPRGGPPSTLSDDFITAGRSSNSDMSGLVNEPIHVSPQDNVSTTPDLTPCKGAGALWQRSKGDTRATEKMQGLTINYLKVQTDGDALTAFSSGGSSSASSGSVLGPSSRAPSSLMNITRRDTRGSSSSLASSTAIDPKFEPLVRVMRDRLRSNPRETDLMRTLIGEDLSNKYPSLYHEPSNKNFKQYSQQAEKAGVVELGGDPPKLWIRLNSKLRLSIGER